LVSASTAVSSGVATSSVGAETSSAGVPTSSVGTGSSAAKVGVMGRKVVRANVAASNFNRRLLIPPSQPFKGMGNHKAKAPFN